MAPSSVSLVPFVLAAAYGCEPQLRFIPDGLFSVSNSSEYAGAVSWLSSSRLVAVPFTRHGGGHRTSDQPMGGRLILPVEERRVRVAEGFRAHVDAALPLPFPFDSRLRGSALPQDLAGAVTFAVTFPGAPLPTLMQLPLLPSLLPCPLSRR